MSVTLNIQTLIESNPISKISTKCNEQLIKKLTENFTTDHQKLFLGSFYCYLNYDSKKDFVIDLDFLWKWLDFSTKRKAKELLFKYFTENIDYIISDLSETDKNNDFALPRGKAKTETRGGSNKQKIMMNIRTFKSMCLKANTKKSNDIQNYFIDLEEAIFEITTRHIDKLESKLRSKLITKRQIGRCVYIVKDTNCESHFKFGKTNDINNRLQDYNCINPDLPAKLLKCWYSPFNDQIEKLVLQILYEYKHHNGSELIEISQLDSTINLVDSLLISIEKIKPPKELEEESQEYQKEPESFTCYNCKEILLITERYTSKLYKQEQDYCKPCAKKLDYIRINRVECSRCNAVKIYKSFFMNNDGIRLPNCKDCYNLEFGASKYCTECNEIKLQSEFHGFSANCKECLNGKRRLVTIELICEFCNRTITNKNIESHQKTTKCLIAQGKLKFASKNRPVTCKIVESGIETIYNSLAEAQRQTGESFCLIRRSMDNYRPINGRIWR
jgi:phage anti-repressor protein